MDMETRAAVPALLQSESTKHVDAALCKVQQAVGNIEHDATNPHFRTTYASLAAIVDATREPLAAAGLVVIGAAMILDGFVVVEVLIRHAETGEFVGCRLCCDPQGIHPQKLGAVFTYLRRYALTMLLNLATEPDDDGEAARANSQQRQQRPAPRPNQSQPDPEPQPDPEREQTAAVLSELLGQMKELTPPLAIETRVQWVAFAQQHTGRTDLSPLSPQGWDKAARLALAHAVKMRTEQNKLYVELRKADPELTGSIWNEFATEAAGVSADALLQWSEATIAELRKAVVDELGQLAEAAERKLEQPQPAAEGASDA